MVAKRHRFESASALEEDVGPASSQRNAPCEARRRPFSSTRRRQATSPNPPSRRYVAVGLGWMRKYSYIEAGGATALVAIILCHLRV